MRCPHCNLTWQPRVPNPKACPRCKRYLNNGKPLTTFDKNFEQINKGEI